MKICSDTSAKLFFFIVVSQKIVQKQYQKQFCAHICANLCKSSWILKQWWRNYRKYESTFSSSECNLPCLMTSDKNYLGDGNIDKFDALFFKIRHFGPRKQGILFLLYQSIVPNFWFIWLCYLSFIGK